MEDVPHSRRAFTATVVKVMGTEGQGGGGGGGRVNATLNGRLCIHVIFWSSCAFAPPIYMCL